ncbi:MAG: superoxide dismutase [Prosthecobacter sp.]|nr:superoxide dismutase [Prosthecobacter sp.]
MLKRRAFIHAAGAALAGKLLAAEAPRVRGVPLTLEPLEFEFAALEPFLDAETLRLHHDVYHRECLAKLNETLVRSNLTVANLVTLMPTMQNLLEPPSRGSVLTLGRKPGHLASDMVESIRVHGGAHVNHTAFWRFLAPPARGRSGPIGKYAQAIQRDFGSIDGFKTAFTKAALNRVGSGWAWLSYRYDGKLIISTTANEDNPLMKDYVAWQDQGKPILCLDLWEHAYYQRYHDDRRKYIAAWWNVVNWKSVERSYGIASA